MTNTLRPRWATPSLRLAACLCGALWATAPLPAAAQLAGQYVGTTSQGAPVEIYIDEDGTGGLSLSLLGVGFTANCLQGKDLPPQFWYAFFDAPIVGAAVSAELRADFLKEQINLQFGPDRQTVTGVFWAAQPAFARAERINPGITACLTGSLSLTARFAAEASGRRPVDIRPGQAIAADVDSPLRTWRPAAR